MSRGIERRLGRLEERAQESAALGAFPPDWPLDDQAEHMMQAILLHRCAGSVQLATDREINVLGILHAFFVLPDGGGEHRMASGAVVTITKDENGVPEANLSGNVSVEDLPESVRKYVERFDPDKQPAREKWLYEHRDLLRDRPFLDKYASLVPEMFRGEGGSY